MRTNKETKPVPGCAGNIGTGNDSGCPLAKPSLNMFELIVCKGTADGGGSTCALDCIMLTGNETDGTEACNGKRLAQCSVLLVMTITCVYCMSEVGENRWF